MIVEPTPVQPEAEAPPPSSGGRRSDREIVLFALGLLAVAAILVLLPDLSPPAAKGLVSERIHARIVELRPSTDQNAPKATIEFLEGPRRGEQETANLEGPSGQLQLPDYAAGDEVVVAVDREPDGITTFSVVDRWRLPLIGGLALVFALVTIAVAGWRGVRSLVALALSLVLAIRVLIPLLLAGWNPLVLAIGLGALVTVVSFVLTQGLTRTTASAIVGTLAGLLITGTLAGVVTALARFTPAQGSEEILVIGQLAGDTIDLSGLLLAAVVFGGLGVLNDVAMSQAATVEEIRSVDPTLGRRTLYGRTMNVGIAHLAATVNTLVFAYLGSALPLLVLFSVQVRGLGFPLNEEIIAVEVVRTLVGSVGIVLTVPITTAIAVRMLTPGPSRRPEPSAKPPEPPLSPEPTRDLGPAATPGSSLESPQPPLRPPEPRS
ncbi:MAG: YibE/F family protein [Chloroflexota bacterium]